MKLVDREMDDFLFVNFIKRVHNILVLQIETEIAYFKRGI
jgi:hypothetical protein